MNCGNNKSGYDRMNKCSERPRREMPMCETARPAREYVKPSCGCEKTPEYVKPSCGCEKPHEYVKPSCGCEKPHEYVKPSCGCEKPHEYVKPSCSCEKPHEHVKPSCGCEKSHEYMKPSCGCEKPHEYMKPSCGCEKPHEYTRPSCNYEMPHNECVKPSHNCTVEKPMVENIIVVNDCSCQEFMRLYDWYNCASDKAHREFMGAEKGLSDAADCIKMGLEYNEKAKEIFDCMEEFLDSKNETDSCENKTAYNNARNKNTCGCNTNCGSNVNYDCNNSVNNGCMPRCTPIKCDPCMKMRKELKEMMCTINKLEEESLEHTKEATDKLMEARRLRKCLCELKNKVAKNCYPKC